MEPASVSSKWVRLLVATLLTLFALASSGSLSAGVAYAEGSRDLYPSGATGFRANLEWRTSFYGPDFLRRRSFLQVYAEPGEVILVGSSAVGVGSGDIQIFNPGTVTGRAGDEAIPATPDFSCEAQRNAPGSPAGQGQITSRAQELAGPDTVPAGGNQGGYVPCFYPAPTTGIYYVMFWGPQGGNSDLENFPSSRIDLITGDPLDFGAGQNTSVSAWDVTVRSNLTSNQDITGRLFAGYLAMITGGSSHPMNSTLYALTTDSYRYQIDLRGLDPYGFVAYSNRVGFLNNDGTSLYHDVLADPTLPVQQQNQMNALVGGVSLAEPTHHLFFNQPSLEAEWALNRLNGPVMPLIRSFVFEGVLGDNQTLLRQGGTFVLDVNVPGQIDLVISRDGIDFDPQNPSNRWLDAGDRDGRQQIPWDGLDNQGNEFGVGSYLATIRLRTGEVHFPLLDIENSQEGGPQYQLLNPPGPCASFPAGCFTGFYDDQGYTTAAGIDVGTPGVELPGINPPVIPGSSPLLGFDTRTNQRAFGDGSENGFGDKKGLDLWTFYPTEANANLNIVALNLMIDKTDGGITTRAGGTIVYTLTYTNTGPTDATGVVITETVPANTSFNATASAPTVWSCPDRSPAGTVCTFSVGNLASQGSGSVRFAMTVADPLPAGVTAIFNTAMIGDDSASGPEPRIDNSATEETPLTGVVPPPSPPQEPPSNSGRRDDPTPTAPQIPVAPSAPAAPPTPAVTFLPETGVGRVDTGAGIWPWAILPGLGLLLGAAIYRRRGK